MFIIKLVGALMSLQFLQFVLSLVNHHSNKLDTLPPGDH